MKLREAYNTSLHPAFPRIRAKLINPVSREFIETDLYIDTGFEGTIILTNNVRENLKLNLAILDEDVYAFHAGYFPLRIIPVIVILEIDKVYKRMIKAYIHPFSKRNLVGREVINNLNMCLRGPEKMLEIF